MHPNRLELHLSRAAKPEPESLPTAEPYTGPEWGCVYATAGPWRARLMARPTVRDIVKQTQEQIISHRHNGDNFSFLHLLARLIDAVHPTHQLPAAVLAYPLYGVNIIKRRLATLGYDIGVGGEDSGVLDAQFALDVVGQMMERLQKEHRYYFEFSTPDKTVWRVGNYKMYQCRRLLGERHNVGIVCENRIFDRQTDPC